MELWDAYDENLVKAENTVLVRGEPIPCGAVPFGVRNFSKHIDGTYKLDAAVDIAVLSDYKALYRVGEGRLLHTSDGFHLTGCDGKLDYTQSPLHAYGLYADYYWYELGDMICIGNKARQYYCFPKENVPVAKARLAVEELYKYKRAEKKRKQE